MRNVLVGGIESTTPGKCGDVDVQVLTADL